MKFWNIKLPSCSQYVMYVQICTSMFLKYGSKNRVFDGYEFLLYKTRVGLLCCIGITLYV